ncbi:MAG: hypothetical protein FWE36_08000 [Erysipelotrichales bacterium]|nr:hypothetical protein [Erysipelotrichales bacterium]
MKITAIKLRLFWFFLGILGIPMLVYASINESDLFGIIGLIVIMISILMGILTPPGISFEGVVAQYYAIPWGNSAKSSIDDWNWNIVMTEVKSIEIVKLSKDERKKYVGKTIFNKYLKILMVSGKEKYLYVSLFSKRQINKIITTINNAKISNKV